MEICSDICPDIICSTRLTVCVELRSWNRYHVMSAEKYLSAFSRQLEVAVFIILKILYCLHIKWGYCLILYQILRK